jgi:putative chitinase
VVTLAQLMAATGAREDRASAALAGINAAMQQYAINTPARIGMFLANVGHETGGLRWLQEIWGPTPAQLRYEGRADLGNTKTGDGSRYRGRGMFQTTGRANYVRLRDRLRARVTQEEVPDFEAVPEFLALPKWAALSAADYVDMRNLNRFADRGAFVDYVKGVNGGTNGLEDRMRLWVAAQKVLA